MLDLFLILYIFRNLQQFLLIPGHKNIILYEDLMIYYYIGIYQGQSNSRTSFDTMTRLEEHDIISLLLEKNLAFIIIIHFIGIRDLSTISV